MSEHFSLQWDDFHKNMSSGMQSLLESEDLADVTLAVEGRQLKAHKMVLSLCSPYFRQLFQSSPCKHPIVFMRDVSYTSLIDLLQFMYQGEVQVAQENFPTFIKTAAALQIKGLAEDSTNQSGEITEATKRHPAEVLPPLPMQCETKAKRCRRLGSKRVRVSSPSPSSSPAAAVEPAENVIFLKTEPSDSVEASTDGEVADETRDSYVDETLLEEDNTLMETNEDSKPGTSSDGIGDSQLIARTAMFEDEDEGANNSSENEHESFIGRPPELLVNTEANSLPTKSKDVYMQQYNLLMNWREKKGAISFSENVILAYFCELSKAMKSSTLWKVYSMLRTTIGINHNIDLSKYSQLRAFLKKKSQGFKAKKSRTLTGEEVNKFLTVAPDSIYLGTKVALIIGIMGACRKHELYMMKIQHLQYLENAILVSVPNTKTKIERKFTITGEFCNTVKKYSDLRPANATTNNFFLNYQRGRCTNQVVGINKLGNMPKQVATFLQLPNPELYTGHSFRRTSATMLVDAGADVAT